MVEQWHIRGQCGACGAVLWNDRPAKVVCCCSASYLGADGELGGEAIAVDDATMIAFIKEDHGREVVLEHVE